MTKVFFSVRRLQRDQESNRERHRLNLVPLMDVFTILVFFFLVHSSEIAPATPGNSVRLPESVADQLPRQTLVLTLNQNEMLLQGLPVTGIDAVLDEPGEAIPALERALRGQLAPGDTAAGDVRELTIMADKSVPFRLLRKVMLSCNRAGFQRIALSVLQKPSGGG